MKFTEQDFANAKIAYDALNAHAAAAHDDAVEGPKAPAFEALEPWSRESFAAAAIAVGEALEAERQSAFATE